MNQISTTYEWVVERLEPDSDDITECSYWPESEFDGALATLAAWEAEGSYADFGLCRSRGDDVNGDYERQYAYALPGERLPIYFGDGRRVPLRFRGFIRPEMAR